jgi:hypothetical protein
LPVSSSGSSSKVTYLQPAAADALIRPGAAAAAANGPAAAGEAAAAPQQNGRDVDMLGPDNAGEAVHQRVSSKASRKRQEPEPDAAAAAGVAADADALAEDEDEDEDMDAAGEQTLGQRVASLEQQQQQQQEAAMAAAGGQQQQQQSSAAAQLPPGPVKADSLSVLLSQALRSGDRALLEQCLGVSNERVIANSVKRLVPLDAALLLRAAVERLQSKPVRGQQMAAWIHAVLLHHTAYLMAAPGAAPVMSSLYSIIEARLSVQRQLLSLAGRLELLLAQAGGQQGVAAGADDAAVAAAGPQVRGCQVQGVVGTRVVLAGLLGGLGFEWCIAGAQCGLVSWRQCWQCWKRLMCGIACCCCFSLQGFSAADLHNIAIGSAAACYGCCCRLCIKKVTARQRLR